MAEIKLFGIKDKVEELPSKQVTLEKELQNLLEKNMNTFFGVTFLKSEYKITNGLPVLDSEREEQVLAECADRIVDPELRPYFVRLQEKIMELGRDRQNQLEAENHIDI